MFWFFLEFVIKIEFEHTVFLIIMLKLSFSNFIKSILYKRLHNLSYEFYCWHVYVDYFGTMSCTCQVVFFHCPNTTVPKREMIFQRCQSYEYSVTAFIGTIKQCANALSQLSLEKCTCSVSDRYTEHIKCTWGINVYIFKCVKEVWQIDC